MVSWALCAFTLLAAGLAIAEQTPFFWRYLWRKAAVPTLNLYSWAPQSVAHMLVLVIIMLVITSQSFGVATLTAALITLFYLAALLIDRRYKPVTGRWLGRFLYLTAAMLIYTTHLGLRHFLNPADIQLTTSIMLIAYAFPTLWLGRYLSHRTPAYGLPLYLTSYAVTLLALAFAQPYQEIFTLYLLIAAAQTVLSAVWFKQPLWLYPTAVFLSIATISGFDWLNFTEYQIGWALALLGGVFFASAAVLRRAKLRRYATPLLAAGLIITALSLIPASTNRLGAQIGFTIVSALYLLVAFGFQWPILLNVALPLVIVPYAITAADLGLTQADSTLAMWPGILMLLAIGRWLDGRWGWLNHERQPFPWNTPLQWLPALVIRIRFSWAFPFYYAGLIATLASPILALLWGEPLHIMLAFSGSALVFTWAMYHFKLKTYLFLAASGAQLAALHAILWLGFDLTMEQRLNLFSPVIVLTAVLALLIEQTLNEDAPFVHDESGWHFKPAGWSRPLYLLLTLNILINSTLIFIYPTSGLALLIQTALLAILTTRWRFPPLAYLTELLVIAVVLEYGSYVGGPVDGLPVTLATIALIYGALSYLFTLTDHKFVHWPEQVMVWTQPLKIGSWLVSFVALSVAITISTMPQVDVPNLFVAVFAILGLLYLTIALAEQKPRVGYGALLLLLISWSTWLFLIRQETEIQLYALPAATYLLGIGWIEWRLGHKLLAGWIDRAAFLLLIGSALWQAFGEWGGLYALVLIAEGLMLVWIGSTRRMRRHLYVGITAVLLAIVSQILEPLFNLNAFILLILGAALAVIGIGLERRLEAVRVLSKQFTHRLEDWD